MDHLRADVGRLSESDGTHEAPGASSPWMQSEAVRDRSVPTGRVVPREFEDVVFVEESEFPSTSEEDSATFQPPPTRIWVGTLG